MENIYVSSDGHGQFQTVLRGLRDIMRPGDKLIYLGDAIDRGPQGYQMLEYLLDPDENFKVTMLRGNHESMLLEFIDEVYALAELKGQKITALKQFWDLADEHSFNSFWVRVNGGDTTLFEMRRLIHSLEKLNQLYMKISKLPYHMTVSCNGKRFYLVHGSPAIRNSERMLWDATTVTRDYSKYGDYIVFGHIITWHYQQEKFEEKPTVFYGSNQIIGIDTGAAFPEYGGCVSFLRLNDLRAFYYDIR